MCIDVFARKLNGSLTALADSGATFGGPRQDTKTELVVRNSSDCEIT